MKYIVTYILSVIFALNSITVIAQDNGLQFDGVDDYVSFASDPVFNSTTTFEAWIYPTSTTGFKTIAEWSDGTGNVVRFYIRDGILELWEDDGFNGGSVSGTVTINIDEWTHVAFVYSASGYIFYINGVSEDIGFPTGSAGATPIFNLGSIPSGFNYYEGILDEVRVWGVELDQTTIQNQMYSTLTGAEANLIAYYQFNESSGTVLPDITSNSIDGTLLNGTANTPPADGVTNGPIWVASNAIPDPFIVTNTNDTGNGSLRWCVGNANTTAGADNITFEASLAGTTITLDAEIIITSGNGDGTTINGDIDGDGKPDIIIAGSGNHTGLSIQAANCTISYLNMIAFSVYPNAAIEVDGVLATGNSIIGNYIGTNLTATATSTANFCGIAIVNGASSNTIGDGTATGQNVISNNSYGVFINGANTNTITGNIIGLDINGATDLGNLGSGVEILSSDGTRIGINGDLVNVISGNNQEGISLTSSTNTIIVNNYIGLSSNGIADLGNNWDGIFINATSTPTQVGDGTAGGRNISSGNGQQGIEIASDNNTVIGNYFGLTADGTTSLGNGSGIWITVGATGNRIGNGSAGGRNVVSGNGGHAIQISDGPNYIYGNYIGLNAAGTLARGNSGIGVFVTGGSASEIGGLVAGQGNVISGNTAGVSISTGPHFVYGNTIGLNAARTLIVANNEGIRLTGSAQNVLVGDGTAAGANFISGNTTDGIFLDGLNANGNIIQNNYIGVLGDLTTPAGNGADGVIVSGDANSNLISNNIISNSGSNGIEANGAFAPGTLNNQFTQNSIYSNNEKGISIVAGAQNGIIAPVITSTANGVITGTSGSNASIEVFADAGNQGKQYLGIITADAAGNWNLTIDPATINTGLSNINATQTDATGNTSEFSVTQALEYSAPSTQASNLLFSNIDIDQMDVSWTNGDGSARIVVVKEGSVVDSNPVDNTTYTANSAFGSGTQIGIGNYVVYNGSGNSFTITGLSSNTTYHFQVFEYNGTSGLEAYNINSAINNPNSQPTPGPFTVTNTNDTGVGSLRWTIDNANITAGSNTITFNIPTSDTNYDIISERWTIRPATDLPTATDPDPIIIDATTQPGTADFRVIIDGQGTLGTGLTLEANFSEVYGLNITRFNRGIYVNFASDAIIGGIGKGNVFNNCSNNAIAILGGGDHIIKGNYIGTDASGTTAIPNGGGINIGTFGHNVTIGGSLAGEENLISGNTGFAISTNVTGNHIIEGNLIGVDITGLNAVANGGGINIGQGSNIMIIDNVISGNSGRGITLNTSSNNFVYGNKIGVGADGTTPIGNNVGVYFLTFGTADNNIIGGTGAGEANIIANNTSYGIQYSNANPKNNPIIGNEIYCNGDKGIFLNGGNEGKTPPLITTYADGSVSGTGTDGDVIHIYRDNTACAPLQGKEYLGSTTIAGGVWTVAEASILSTDLINATATDATNNTSEFAINYGEILVYQGSDNSGTQIFDAQVTTVDVGTGTQGSDYDQIFTIENKSGAVLTINSISVSGTDFSIINIPTSVNANSSVNFTVRLSGGTLGTFSDIITIDSDDTDESIFTFDVTGTISTPEIEVFHGVDNTGTPITDAQVTAIDFGNELLGTDILVTFAIENTGSATLTISSITVSGTAYSISGTPASVAVGITATFDITLSGANLGAFTETITINNDDIDENPFTFDVTGAIVAPEINIYQGIDNAGTPITDAQVTAIDFASSPFGTDVTLPFAIENTGDATLNISSVVVSGTAYTVVGAPASVAVGTITTFDITLSGATPGTFTETVTINNDDADENPFTFDITGEITAPEIEVFQGTDNTGTPIVDAQVATIDFNSGLQGTDIPVTFAIENTGSATLTITSITVSGTAYSVSGAPTSIVAGITSTFDITLSGASVGTFTETVTINNDDPDENPFTFDVIGNISALPEPEINVYVGPNNTGTLLTDGQATAVDFESAFVGFDITLPFTIENTGATDLNITSISTGGSDFIIIAIVTPITITAGASETFGITLRAQVAGTFNDIITIQNNDTDEAVFNFPVTGIINALPSPEIELYSGTDNTGTPITDAQVTAIDFASSPFGTDVTLPFAIENTGNATLNISSVVVSGTAYMVVGAPASVAVGTTTTFDITLSGATPGTFTETVMIYNNDTDENSFNFDVTGTINAIPAAEINVYQGADNSGIVIMDGQVSVIDFGIAPAGTDIDQVFAIENTGTADLTIEGIILNSTDYSTVGTLPTIIAPGTSETFTIRLSGATPGTFNDNAVIFNNDSDELNFSFPITGIIETVDVVVFNGDNTSAPVITNGQPDAIDLGQTEQYSPILKTFTIQNPGSTDINIQSIAIDNSLFEIIEPPTLIPANASVQFTIQLNADEVGVFNANATIESDLGTYAFPVTGEVVAAEPGAITVFNAVSPNGDGKHDYLELRGIEAYASNQVRIMNRWGDIVFEMSSYDNNTNRFEGIANKNGSGDLPPGTYFYSILLGDSSDEITGFFSLRR
ncbi:MAG: choice-of-anchor D domain-containing protein [Bacteroidota bacterium]